ncbi:VTT domain-containing protein [Magnetovibrio sp.]|uniref:TVP38/TMEM64 family protein n=1 Tax=Magnetovibrio sp. TaxID=2024836 RepID=UPI002F92AE7A
MTSLLKLGLALALAFLSTFIVIKAMGWITVDDVRGWLQAGQTASPHMVGLIVTGLLFADLFIAVPTLTVTLLSGHFLGFELGFAYALSGYWLAGGTGYALSRAYGRRALVLVTKDAEKIAEMESIFNRHGLMVLSMARAMPILAEVSACLAGATRMPFRRFALGWAINSVPYAAIAAYGGSVSSLADPKPALFTAIGLTGVLWLGWYIFTKRAKRAAKPSS